MVHRQGVLFRGRKMKATLMPAFWVVVGWFAVFAAVTCSATTMSFSDDYWQFPDVTVEYDHTDGANKIYNVSVTHYSSTADNPASSVTIVGVEAGVEYGTMTPTGLTGWSQTSQTKTATLSVPLDKTLTMRVKATSSISAVYNYNGGQFQSSADTDCVVVFPATKNTTGYPIHYRIVHSIDGTVATIIVQPGQSVPRAEYAVTCGGTYQIQYQVPDAGPGNNGDGTWTVIDGTDADPDGWKPGTPIPDTGPDDEHPDPPMPENPTGPNDEPLPQAPKDPAPPWQGPTAPTVDDERLDKQTFKQGVDKVVAELQEQTKELKKLNKAPDAIPSGDPTIPDRPAVPHPEEDLLPGGTVPNFFTGSLNTSTHEINVSLPSITALGRTYPAKILSIDLADYSAVIVPFRALLSGILWILFFILITRTATWSSK